MARPKETGEGDAKPKAKRNHYEWEKVLAALPAALERFAIEYPGVKPLIREIFYQYTSMDEFGKLSPVGLLPNVKKAYKSFDHWLVEWRVAGKIPWGTFRTDESRESSGGDWWDKTPLQYAESRVKDLRDSIDGFGLSYWKRQGHRGPL